MRFVAWVYIMTNWSRSVLYVGRTTNLPARVWEHRTKRNASSFTARYSVNRLVFFQGFLSVREAETAEAYIKGKTRAWKKELISKQNPTWKELSSEARGD